MEQHVTTVITATQGSIQLHSIPVSVHRDSLETTVTSKQVSYIYLERTVTDIFTSSLHWIRTKVKLRLAHTS